MPRSSPQSSKPTRKGEGSKGRSQTAIPHATGSRASPELAPVPDAAAPALESTGATRRPAFALLDLPDEVIGHISRFWNDHPFGLPTSAHSCRSLAACRGPQDVAIRAAARFGPEAALPRLLAWGGDVDSVAAAVRALGSARRAAGADPDGYSFASEAAKTWRRAVEVVKALPPSRAPVLAEALLDAAPWPAAHLAASVPFALGEPDGLNDGSALHFACRAGVSESAVRKLLAAGADANAEVLINQTTPLMVAAEYGAAHLLPVLLKAGARPRARNCVGATALVHAAAAGRAECAAALLAHEAYAPAHAAEWEAVSAGPGPLRADDRATALLAACAISAHAGAASALLAAGVDPDSRFEPAELDALLNCWKRDLPRPDDVASALVGHPRRYSWSPRPAQLGPFTALHCACVGGGVDLARALLAAGADPEAPLAVLGASVLPIALAAAEGNMPVVRALQDAGASLEARDAAGHTVLGAAVARGADAFYVGRFLHAGADPNPCAADGPTPLMGACAAGSVGLARRLMQAGADLNARGPGGETALGEACKGGWKDVSRFLLEAGAEIGAREQVAQRSRSGRRRGS